MTPDLKTKKRKLLIGNIEVEVAGLSIDSRSIKPGEVFFALQGNKVDGHQFVSKALDNGAIAAVIEDIAYHKESRTILVDNVLNTLKESGIFLKNSANPKCMIGITGSVGKTTTKAWLSKILNYYHKSFTTMNNYNTIYGLPIALSNIEDETEYCILEMGTSRAGEISDLSSYLSPDIGIITNIFESHIGYFNNKLELAKEKISITDGMHAGSILIFDGDSEFAETIKAAALAKQIRTLSVGFSSNCDIRIISGQRSVIRTTHNEYSFQLSIHGRKYDYIAGCVVALLFALGLEIEKFLAYFTKLKPLPGRGEIITCNYYDKKFTLIDESYNASPAAMLAAIDTFLGQSHAPPLVAIIGQMNDLGRYEEYYHKLVAERLATCNLNSFFFIGRQELWKIYPKAICYEGLNEGIIKNILDHIPKDALILLKGSNSIHLGEIPNYILSSSHRLTSSLRK
ncbi:MAG: UDP-N-acetylmuramoyl-tripeptide--D-alanyl-D-alanine ligase [Holosporales bacterium]|jgi:UDP-N-acetylmuramoyl-tripeptide--D-alanyl-D-alanine ligase|nr:UDP-N-acetylmuramoyl-tripeptide--D-alanyl-D-alanine ligase [Holosporales bacterium]